MRKVHARRNAHTKEIREQMSTRDGKGKIPTVSDFVEKFTEKTVEQKRNWSERHRERRDEMQDERLEERVHALRRRENGRDEPVRVQIDISRRWMVDDIRTLVDGRKREVFAREEHIASAGEERRRRRSIFRKK